MTQQTTKTILWPDYKIDCVKAYTQAGYTLFSCGNPKNAKAPFKPNWQETPYNPDLDPFSLKDMYGVLLGPNDLIIDVDPKNYANGVDSWQTMVADLKLPKIQTLVVRTPSGGFHIYLKMPPGTVVRKVAKEYPGIDIQYAGLYIVAAGSKHKPGHYEIVRGSPGQIASAPSALLDFLAPRTEVGDSGDDFETDDDSARSLFIRHIHAHAPKVVPEGTRDNTTYQMACEGRDFGLSNKAVLEILLSDFAYRIKPALSEDEIAGIVDHAFQYAQNKKGSRNPISDFADVEPVAAETLEESPGGKLPWDFADRPKVYDNTSLSNCVNFFRMPNANIGGKHGGKKVPNPLHKLVRYNTFAHAIEFLKPAPWHNDEDAHPFWTDEDTVELKLWVNDKQHFSASTSLWLEAVIAYSRLFKYHPVRDYLNSLEWDGIERIDRFLPDYAGTADDELTRCFGKCFLIGAVARIFEPGCQMDTMLVLEGPQGVYKTSLVRVLGGEWYADIHLDPHNKDTITNLLGCWIVEASEMEFTSKSEVGAIKRFLTITKDRVRLPYGKLSITIPREHVWAGTVNPADEGYLRDSTGNRRFWPVLTLGIDIERIRQDRDQLFAEAVVRYRKGDKWYITDKRIEALAEQAQKAREVSDSWDQIIATWLRASRKNLPEFLTTEYVGYGALNIPMHKLGQPESRRIAQAMKRDGWVRAKRYNRETKQRMWCWVRDTLEGL